MQGALSLMRAGWLVAASYRARLVFSLLGLAASVFPLYLIANALQPVMADPIRGEGGGYFGFLLFGSATLALAGAAVNAIPGAVGSGIGNGTLEAYVSSRTSWWLVLAGLSGQALGWAMIRGLVLVAAGAVLGVSLHAAGVLPALVVLVLLVLAYAGIGLVAAAMVIEFRSAGPLPQGVLVLSALLGGAYYPTHVIPSWLGALSDVVPLTYGLRALRRLLLDGAPLAAVGEDVAMLAALALIAAGVGLMLCGVAITRARRAGTLAQY